MKSPPVCGIVRPPFINLLISKTASSSIHYFNQSMTSKDQTLSGAMARVAPTKDGKPYKCRHAKCSSRGFKTVGAKQRHEREQHNAKPKCDYCDFTAKRHYQMKYHMETDHPEQIGDTLELL